MFQKPNQLIRDKSGALFLTSLCRKKKELLLILQPYEEFNSCFIPLHFLCFLQRF